MEYYRKTLVELLHIKLKELATVQMGYSFRSRLEPSPSAGLAVIQMKDLLDNNRVSCDNLVRIHLDSPKELHLVHLGDLIFRSRGLLSTSAIVLDDPGRAVLAAPLFRIRIIKPEKLRPEYLNWYISQREAQSFFSQRARGTVQKMISKQVLEELEITLPSLEKQDQIIELAKLSAREQALLGSISQKRGLYISRVLMSFVSEPPKRRIKD